MSQALKNIIITLLAGSFVLSLAACAASDADNVPKDTTASVTDAVEPDAEVESGDARLYPDLPETDWNGATFNVMGRTHETYWFFRSFEIYAESENGETVNDAVFRRNRDIEEKYNVKITQDLVIEPQTELPKLVAAGDSVHDMAFQNQLNVHTVAATGALMDLYTLDYIDFDKPWW